MSKIIEQHLDSLSDAERAALQELASKAEMTLEDWVSFRMKAQIYHNAEERLGLSLRKEAA